MAMKKKFLGLAMAAMVAMPASAAYADTFQWNDGTPQKVDVTISGSVTKNDGLAPEGRLEVELPTTMDFSVDKNGKFVGTSYKITNRSQSPVDVSVANFTETNAQGGINILPITDANTIDTKGRENVIMALVGDNNQYVDLGAFTKGKKLLTVDANHGVGTIELTGVAGEQTMGTDSSNPLANGVTDDTGVSEKFNLVFQIKKG